MSATQAYFQPGPFSGLPAFSEQGGFTIVQRGAVSEEARLADLSRGMQQLIAEAQQGVGPLLEAFCKAAPRDGDLAAFKANLLSINKELIASEGAISRIYRKTEKIVGPLLGLSSEDQASQFNLICEQITAFLSKEREAAKLNGQIKEAFKDPLCEPIDLLASLGKPGRLFVEPNTAVGFITFSAPTEANARFHSYNMEYSCEENDPFKKDSKDPTKSTFTWQKYPDKHSGPIKIEVDGVCYFVNPIASVFAVDVHLTFDGIIQIPFNVDMGKSLTRVYYNFVTHEWQKLGLHGRNFSLTAEDLIWFGRMMEKPSIMFPFELTLEKITVQAGDWTPVDLNQEYTFIREGKSCSLRLSNLQVEPMRANVALCDGEDYMDQVLKFNESKAIEV